MSTTTTLKLTRSLKSRIAAVAKQTNRSPHRLMIGAIRELAISYGRTGYVALYRLLPATGEVRILAVKHQREFRYPL